MPRTLITAPQLKEWIEKDEAIVVDVRTAYEYYSVNIRESINLPAETITQETFATLPPRNGKKLVLLCRSGIRSKHACFAIEKFNPEEELFDLEFGILAWACEKYDLRMYDGQGNETFYDPSLSEPAPL